jgi:DNA-binding CsgD family transcriptional regulator
VPALTASDSEQVLRFVAEAEGADREQPFSPELLLELGKLVRADWLTYCELDRVQKRDLLVVDRAGDEVDGEVDDAVFWDFVIDEHPVCLRHQQGHVGALKLSDFVTRRQLHRTRLYDVWFRPCGVEHELNVPIPSPLWHTKTFLFDRGPGRDFTERDRLVLDLLRPHLARVWRAARTRRRLAALLLAVDQASNQDMRGVILLVGGDRIEFASPPARRMLNTFFAHSGGRLPAGLTDWLEAGAPGRLIRRRDGRTLTVTADDDILLVEERQADALLTAREREVLAWVARGKTNAEIARLLWLAPSTVRKHLENVYAKLGVNTRTAAVARFLGLLDAEASESGYSSATPSRSSSFA